MLLEVFINNIIPPLLVVAAGYLLDKLVGVDLRTLSRVAIYVFTPALIAGSMIETDLAGGELGQIALFTIAFMVLGYVASLGVTRLLRFDQARTNTFMLSTLFNNCGNLGLAVVLFAFGQEGLERGLVFFVTSSLLTHTLAVYFASRGKFDARQSFLNIFRLPLVYALAGALLVRLLGITVPEPLMRAIDLPQVGAIPIMQLLLGVQLARTSRHVDLLLIGSATLVRLVGGAAIGLGLSALMGLQGVARSASVVQASMPTAVSVVALSVEFGADAEQVGSVVFFSTLASALTLTLLIAFLA